MIEEVVKSQRFVPRTEGNLSHIWLDTLPEGVFLCVNGEIYLKKGIGPTYHVVGIPGITELKLHEDLSPGDTFGGNYFNTGENEVYIGETIKSVVVFIDDTVILRSELDDGAE